MHAMLVSPHQTVSLRTHGASAPVECQETLHRLQGAAGSTPAHGAPPSRKCLPPSATARTTHRGHGLLAGDQRVSGESAADRCPLLPCSSLLPLLVHYVRRV